MREDHTAPGEAVNTLVAIDLAAGGPGEVLVSGADFYATARLSPAGDRLSWLSWHHPDMPWDATTLSVAAFAADGTLAQVEQIAGGPGESIFQPTWSPDGLPYYVSDRSGWWNLYRRTTTGDEALYPMEAEFGRSLWTFDLTTYGFAAADRIIYTYVKNGVSRLAALDPDTQQLTPFDLPYPTISNLHANGATALFIAGSPTEPLALLLLDLADGSYSVLRRSSAVPVDPGYLSLPEAIEFPSDAGATYAFYYAPRNKSYQAPPGELPPLIVQSHGGPTGATSPVLDLLRQFGPAGASPCLM